MQVNASKMGTVIGEKPKTWWGEEEEEEDITSNKLKELHKYIVTYTNSELCEIINNIAKNFLFAFLSNTSHSEPCIILKQTLSDIVRLCRVDKLTCSASSLRNKN